MWAVVSWMKTSWCYFLSITFHAKSATAKGQAEGACWGTSCRLLTLLIYCCMQQSTHTAPSHSALTFVSAQLLFRILAAKFWCHLELCSLVEWVDGDWGMACKVGSVFVSGSPRLVPLSLSFYFQFHLDSPTHTKSRHTLTFCHFPSAVRVDCICDIWQLNCLS